MACLKVSNQICQAVACCLKTELDMPQMVLLLWINNSVWTQLKAAVSGCVPFKCICHSLPLCIQYAVGKLASNIEFFISEIHHWFSHNEMRREAYKQLFKLMNPSNDESTGTDKTTTFPFLKPSVTSWLVRGKVMYNVFVAGMKFWHILLQLNSQKA